MISLETHRKDPARGGARPSPSHPRNAYAFAALTATAEVFLVQSCFHPVKKSIASMKNPTCPYMAMKNLTPTQVYIYIYLSLSLYLHVYIIYYIYVYIYIYLKICMTYTYIYIWYPPKPTFLTYSSDGWVKSGLPYIHAKGIFLYIYILIV